MMLQSQYRLSAVYEVAVVLIESQLPVHTPLPVLKRGSDGKGPLVLPDVLPFPTLFSVRLKQQPVRLPARRGAVAMPTDPNTPLPPSARLGDTLVVSGHRLDGLVVSGAQTDSAAWVRFTNLRRGFIREILPDAGATANEMQITLPGNSNNLSDPNNFATGFHTLAVLFRQKDATGAPNPNGIIVGETNELTFSLVPQIQAINPGTAKAGDITITVTCNPAVQPGQRVSLLFSSREIIAQPFTNPTQQLTFEIKAAVPGDYYLRLRVDGIDSLLVDPAVDPIVTPPVFDPAMKVTITP